MCCFKGNRHIIVTVSPTELNSYYRGMNRYDTAEFLKPVLGDPQMVHVLLPPSWELQKHGLSECPEDRAE